MHDDDDESPLNYQSITAPLDVAALLQEMQLSVTGASEVMTRLHRDRRTINCVWDGQTGDGLKRRGKDKTRVMPWEGASDAVVRVAADIVGEMADTCLLGLKVAQPTVIALGEVSPEAVGTMRMVLAHYMHGPMASHWLREIRRACYYAHAAGAVVVRTEWEREECIEVATMTGARMMEVAVRLASESLVLEHGEEGAVQAVENGLSIERLAESQLLALLADPERRDDLEALMLQVDPVMAVGEAARMAKELVSFDQELRYHRIAERGSMPLVNVLRPLVDVIFPMEAKAIEDERWVAQVHWLALPELEEQAMAQGWDGDWLARAKKLKGRAWGVFGLATVKSWVLGGAGVGREPTGDWCAERVMLLEVFTRPMTNAGARAVFRTVLHPGITDSAALHEVYDRAHGTLPFRGWAPFQYQVDSLMEAMSVPELVRSEQGQIKHQVDSWRDNTSLRAAPPLSGPVLSSAGANEPRIAPGAWLPMTMGPAMGEFRPMIFPAMSADAQVIIEESRARVARLLGLSHPGVTPGVQQAKGQARLDWWLDFYSRLVSVVGQLIQQFTSDIVATRVAGLTTSVRAAAEDIRGHYLFRFSADVGSLDPERRDAKVEMLIKILSLDHEARVDKGELTARLLNDFDPGLAAAVLRDSETAAAEEGEDEQRAVAVMLSGLRPPARKGQNHALRLQVIEQQQQNPSVARAIEANPQVAELLEERRKFHQVEVDQINNKLIGRNEGGAVVRA